LHSQLEIQYGGLQADFDNLKAQLDEEADGAATMRSQLQKSQAEYQTLKSKYDKDVSARSDELDELRSSSPSLGHCQLYENCPRSTIEITPTAFVTSALFISDLH